MRALSRSVKRQPVASASLNKATIRQYHASVLPSLISTTSPEFQENAQGMEALIQSLDMEIAQVRMGGGTKAIERMRSKGKKLPRERCVFFLGMRSDCLLCFFLNTCWCTGLPCYWILIHPSLSCLHWPHMASTPSLYQALVSSPA